MVDITGQLHLIQLRRELKADLDELQCHINSIDETLKEIMRSDPDGMVNGIRLVHWTQDRPRVFNLDRFKAKHPDLYEEFREESSRRRFLVSVEDD